MLRNSVSEKSKLSIAFSKLYHSSAKKSMRMEKKREKCRVHGLVILGKSILYGSASRIYHAVSAVLCVFPVDVRGFLGFFVCTGGVGTDFSSVV